MNLIFHIHLKDVGRFRVNVFKQRDSHAIALRVITFKIPTLDELRHPTNNKGFNRKEKRSSIGYRTYR